MPDLPISGLPSASALAGTEPVPIVQGGVTVKTTTADIAALASGVSDGDKGDITVSSSGAVWTIDAAAVSNSKLANVATATFKGRTTAGTGSPEDLTVAQAKTLLNLAGTNTGDQTITLTGDVTGSGTGSFAATIANDTVTNAKAANMATATIKGRATAGTGDPEDLTATQVKTLLAIAAGDVSGLAAIATSGSSADLSGTKTSAFISDFTEAAQDSVGVMVDSTIVYNDATPTLGRAAITGDVTISAGSNAATIPAGTVTLAKQANLAANSIVGNNTGLAATPIALTATQATAMLNTFTDVAKGLVPASGGGAANFLRADGTFAAPPTGGVTDGDKGDITVSSGGTVWTIDNDAVTYSKIQNVAGNSFLGRAASGAGDVGEITVGASELVGRGSTGNIAPITLGTNLSMSGTTLNASGGGISDGDKGDITVSSGGTVWTIDNTAVSNAKLADVATATFKGRTTVGTGSPEDLTVAQAKTLLDLAGTNTGDQTITLTGDVTGSGTGSFAATIANDTVTNAKAANMATATIKGRTTAGTGDPEDLTATQVKTLLAISASDVSGLAAIATSGSAADLSGTKNSTFIADFAEASQDTIGGILDATLVYNDATPSIGRAAITGDVTISAGSNAATIPAGTVTLAKQANLAANSIVGNNTGVAATPIALTATQTTAMLNTFTDIAKGLVPASGGGTTNFLRADGTFAAPPGGGGVTDGDKGDITVSGSGATWTIDNNVVTNAKAADVPTATIKGRITAATGDPEDLTPTQAKSVLAITASDVSGLPAIATQIETDAGVSDSLIVTPLKLADSVWVSKKFSANFGDGVATSYVITHNLNTRDVDVEIYRNSGNYDTVLCEIQRTSVNQITIISDVVLASNSLRVKIST